MNSMNKIIDYLKETYEIKSVKSPMDMQFHFETEKKLVHSILGDLKSKGFKQLSLITAVDWIEENEFQLTYILFNWDNGIHAILNTRLDRDNPKFTTILPIFPGAEYYERDVHEFFGIEFKGNEKSFKPLFLEMWDELPPLRKDFDPQAFSDKTFPKMEYTTQFLTDVGGVNNEGS